MYPLWQWASHYLARVLIGCAGKRATGGLSASASLDPDRGNPTARLRKRAQHAAPSAASKKVVPEMGGMGKLCLPVQLRDSTGKLRLPMAPEKLNDLAGNGTSF